MRFTRPMRPLAMTLSAFVAFTGACAVHRPQPASADLARALVFERASQDFACPLDRIELGPCSACMGVLTLRLCGFYAAYGYDRRDDGGYDVFLMMAASPPRRAR